MGGTEGRPSRPCWLAAPQRDTREHAQGTRKLPHSSHTAALCHSPAHFCQHTLPASHIAWAGHTPAHTSPNTSIPAQTVPCAGEHGHCHCTHCGRDWYIHVITLTGMNTCAGTGCMSTDPHGQPRLVFSQIGTPWSQANSPGASDTLTFVPYSKGKHRLSYHGVGGPQGLGKTPPTTVSLASDLSSLPSTSVELGVGRGLSLTQKGSGDAVSEMQTGMKGC